MKQEIRVPSLYGGVSTLASSKIMPNELKACTNAMLSRERSWERRAPLELIPEKQSDGSLANPSSVSLSLWDAYPTSTELDQSWVFSFIVRSDRESYVVAINADFHGLSAWGGLPATTGGDTTYGQYYSYDSGNPSVPGFLKMWATDGTPQVVILDLPRTGMLTTPASTPPISTPWTLNSVVSSRSVATGSDAYALETFSNADTWGEYLYEGHYVSSTQGYKASDRIKFCTVQDTTFILNTQRNFSWFPEAFSVGSAMDFWCSPSVGVFTRVKDDIQVDGDGLEIGHCRENFTALPIPTVANLLANSGIDNVTTPTALAVNQKLQMWDIYRMKFPDQPNTNGTAPGSGEAYTTSGGSTEVTEPYVLRKSSGGTDYYQSTAGLGEVYYCRKGIGIYPPGYYRVVSLNAPYYEHIRDPGPNCMVSPLHMPLRLRNVADGIWVLDTPYFEPRKSGDEAINPGPEAWSTDESAEISDLKIWRNRMWMSSGNRLFSSRQDNIYDFFKADPTQLPATDPVDLNAGGDRVANITSLLEATDTMLVITDSDDQFEVAGSDNIISTNTISLSRVSAFTTNKFTRPMRIGRAVYYFSQDKLFLYYSNPQALTTITEDLSKKVVGYLPYKHRASVAFPAHSMLVTVDDLDPASIYINYSMFDQDKLATNAYHKWELPMQVLQIASISDIEDNTYLYGMFVSDEDDKLYLGRVNLDPRKNATSFLDCLRETGDSTCSSTYNAGQNRTEITTRGGLAFDTVTQSTAWPTDSQGVELSITGSTSGSDVNGTYNTYYVAGDKTAHSLWIGKKYTSSFTLPEPVLRDPDTGAYIHNLLNVTRVVFAYDRSGPFDVTAANNLTLTNSWQFANTQYPYMLNHSYNEAVTTFGEYRFLVFKPAGNLNITVSTDSPNPLNILSATYEVRSKRKANPRLI